ncbi:hypothetical protein [Aquibium oceanicum]|uniref:Uncharacterized protein n=1 Tax=Aquibium oceanicum TaxID=1670800 RepID=A0A1L3SQ28_9HYPH|nr:hypothetical protein [Aquibium oceanicum]APH71461.1 hypothetical protein BSQ44_08830 [Aquibium oceanicum]
MTTIEIKAGAIVSNNDHAPLVDYMQWYDDIAVCGGKPNVLDDEGRISALQHIGRGDRVFHRGSDFSPAVPAVLNGVRVLDFANTEGQGAGNLSRGYEIPLSMILEDAPITSLTIAAIVQTYPLEAGTQAIVDITDPETGTVLLQQNVQASGLGTTQFVARRTAADTSTAVSEQSVGYPNGYQAIISTVNYAAGTGFINHQNLGNAATANIPLVNTGDIGPASWHPDTVMRIGKASDASGRHFLKRIARLWVRANMTPAGRTALADFMVPIRIRLSAVV